MGLATATVKGGFWPENGVVSLASIQGSGQPRRAAARSMGMYALMDDRRVMSSLLGVAPGAAALKQLTRVEANVELGGKRLTELYTFVNRNTTAQDITDLNNDILGFSGKTWYGNSPPVNKDGNPLGTR